MKILRNSLALATTLRLPIAFDPGKPGWKLDADGKVEMKDGNPIFINSAGQEQTVRSDTISTLNGEAKSHRERAEKAEAELKKFEGISDPAAALKAIETVSKLDAKQLIDAGEVDKVKEAIKAEMSGQMSEKDKHIESLQGNLNNLMKSTAFKGSEYIRNRIAVPPEMFERTFADNFKVEDGKLVPYGPDGNKVYSKKNYGEVATFDEAVEILVENSPWKDQILKAPNSSGSGNDGGGGGHQNGKTVIKRADYNTFSPEKQAEYGAKAAKGEVVLAD